MTVGLAKDAESLQALIEHRAAPADERLALSDLIGAGLHAEDDEPGLLIGARLYRTLTNLGVP